MAIYYVRPDGSNTNIGTGYLAAQAWATISKAASAMVAGDTVYIAPGTYREAVIPTNSGASGNAISYIGDRKCQYFLDKTAGDVIISGMNTEGDASITRSNGFYAYSYNYISISNIDVENVSSMAFAFGTYGTMTNCNATKGILGSGIITTGNYLTATNCKIISTSTALSIGNNQNTTGGISNCVFKTLGGYSVITIASGYTAYLTFCIISGGYTSVSNAQLIVYGCIWSCDRPIAVSAGTSLIQAKGTVFIGKASTFAISVNGCQFYGCKFYGFNLVNIDTASITATFSCCEFEGSTLNVTTTQSVSSCYFKGASTVFQIGSGATLTASGCRYYGVFAYSAGAGTFTNSGANYGEIDVLAGIVASATNPLSGSKSLRLAGYDYAPVYVLWVKCQAGVPKTITFKAKSDTSTASGYVRLGDQTISLNTDTTVDSYSITYTHHKNDLVPLFICPRVASVSDTIRIDDIAA